MNNTDQTKNNRYRGCHMHISSVSVARTNASKDLLNSISLSLFVDSLSYSVK